MAGEAGRAAGDAEGVRMRPGKPFEFECKLTVDWSAQLMNTGGHTDHHGNTWKLTFYPNKDGKGGAALYLSVANAKQLPPSWGVAVDAHTLTIVNKDPALSCKRTSIGRFFERSVDPTFHSTARLPLVAGLLPVAPSQQKSSAAESFCLRTQ